MQHRWSRYILLLMLGLGLVSRVGSLTVAWHQNPACILNPDSLTYDQPARALARTGRFAASPEQPDTPEVMRTPGYPLFIATVYKVCGEKSHAPVIFLQIIVSVAVAALTFYLGGRLFGAAAGLIATGLVLIEPVTFLHSQMLLTETLFSLFVVLIAIAGLKVLERLERPLGRALVLGLCIALSAFVRPIGYYLIAPVLAGLVAVMLIKKIPARRVAAAALALALPWVLLVGGWQLRNARVAGRGEFSYIQSYNLLWYRGAGIIALRDRITLEAAQAKIKAQFPSAENAPIGPLCATYAREGVKLIRQYPGLFVRESAGGLKSLLLGLPGGILREFYGYRSVASPIGDLRTLPLRQFVERWLIKQPGLLALSLYVIIGTVVVYLGLLFIPWGGLRRAGPGLAVHLFIAGVTLYLILISAGPEAYCRFRTPLIPLVAIYSGAGWHWLGGRVCRSCLPLKPNESIPN